MALTLHAPVNDYRAERIAVTAAFAGVEIAITKSDMKAFYLSTPQGNIYQSGAIARYVARLRSDSGLTGNSFYESGLVDSWCEWCAHDLEPARALWLFPVLGFTAHNPKAYNEAKKDVATALGFLNKMLLNRTFFLEIKLR